MKLISVATFREAFTSIPDNHQVQESFFLPASLFKPIDCGFYFSIGDADKLDSTIKHSIIITNSINKIKSRNSNVIIFVNVNPQIVYYRILNEIYSTKSNGLVCQSSIISKEAYIGLNVEIGSFCKIGNAVIQDNVIIKNHVVIEDNCIIRSGSIIESHSVIV